jgi:hypothetical protein
MSSPERDLLKRHCNWKLSVEEHLKLLRETEKLLAQPAKHQFTTRLDQDPVMYQYRGKLDGKDWGRWNLCNKIDYEEYKNYPTFQHWTYQTRKLLAQPEQEPVAWMYEEATSFNKDGYFSEWLPCFYLEKADEDKSLRNETPLYASPPKREPLSDEEIKQTTQGMSEFGADMFKAGVVAAEKAHGIGG